MGKWCHMNVVSSFHQPSRKSFGSIAAASTNRLLNSIEGLDPCRPLTSVLGLLYIDHQIMKNLGKVQIIGIHHLFIYLFIFVDYDFCKPTPMCS